MTKEEKLYAVCEMLKYLVTIALSMIVYLGLGLILTYTLVIVGVDVQYSLTIGLSLGSIIGFGRGLSSIGKEMDKELDEL